jgi:hypothetical protein
LVFPVLIPCSEFIVLVEFVGRQPDLWQPLAFPAQCHVKFSFSISFALERAPDLFSLSVLAPTTGQVSIAPG